MIPMITPVMLSVNNTLHLISIYVSLFFQHETLFHASGNFKEQKIHRYNCLKESNKQILRTKCIQS